jgi:hypothetical protein
MATPKVGYQQERAVTMLKKWFLLMSVMTALTAAAQDISAPNLQLGTISGTVADLDGNPVRGQRRL